MRKINWVYILCVFCFLFSACDNSLTDSSVDENSISRDIEASQDNIITNEQEPFKEELEKAGIKTSLFNNVEIPSGGFSDQEVRHFTLFYKRKHYIHIDMLTKSAIDDYVKNAEFIGSVKRIDYTQEPVEDFECTFLFDGTALYLTDSGLIVAVVTDEMAVTHEGVTYRGALLGTTQDFYNYYGIEVID